MKYPNDWHFPMKCPVCAAAGGTPFRVSTSSGLLAVDIECGVCLYEWPLTAPAPSMFVAAEAPVSSSLERDRRREPD